MEIKFVPIGWSVVYSSTLKVNLHIYTIQILNAFLSLNYEN